MHNYMNRAIHCHRPRCTVRSIRRVDRRPGKWKGSDRSEARAGRHFRAEAHTAPPSNVRSMVKFLLTESLAQRVADTFNSLNQSSLDPLPPKTRLAFTKLSSRLTGARVNTANPPDQDETEEGVLWIDHSSLLLLSNAAAQLSAHQAVTARPGGRSCFIGPWADFQTPSFQLIVNTHFSYVFTFGRQYFHTLFVLEIFADVLQT